MIERKCSCEMGLHKAPLEKCIIESGAVKYIPELLYDYNRIYMVCDENTYKVLGEKVEKLFENSGKEFYKHILKGDVLPDAKNIGDVFIHLYNPKADSDIFDYSPKPDFILGVGSGVINDICRLVSFRVGIPYGITATAPSMDGYASAGSPTLFDSTKATIKCTTPKYIVADLDVIKNAPIDMLYSGIGDMFGKYTAMLDWELARDYSGEYFCDEIAKDVIDATNLCLKNGYNIDSRSEECIKNIMEGFLVTGIGMAFTGNSRPASGSEHIVAHAWELQSVERGEKPNLHGIEVCEGTLLIAETYRLLYEETDDTHLKELIKKYLPYFDEVESFCKNTNMPYIKYTYNEIFDGINRALTLRDRYTVLFYLRDKGMFERYAQYAANKLLEVINNG